ncbi:hypothetical protein LCGC14_2101910, partial [marine sediment metagenome]
PLASVLDAIGDTPLVDLARLAATADGRGRYGKGDD